MPAPAAALAELALPAGEVAFSEPSGPLATLPATLTAEIRKPSSAPGNLGVAAAAPAPVPAPQPTPVANAYIPEPAWQAPQQSAALPAVQQQAVPEVPVTRAAAAAAAPSRASSRYPSRKEGSSIPAPAPAPAPTVPAPVPAAPPLSAYQQPPAPYQMPSERRQPVQQSWGMPPPASSAATGALWGLLPPAQSWQCTGPQLPLAYLQALGPDGARFETDPDPCCALCCR